MELSPMLWLLQTLPESLALVSMTIAMSKDSLEIKKIALLGFLLAVAIFLIRLLPLAFGFHFFIFIVFLAVLLNVYIKVSLSRSLLTALIAGLILAVSETLFMTLTSLATGIPMEQVTQSTLLHIIHAWPHIVFMFTLALAIKWFRKRYNQKVRGKDAKIYRAESC